MRRRALLSLLAGSAVGGCVGSPAAGETDTDETDADEAATSEQRRNGLRITERACSAPAVPQEFDLRCPGDSTPVSLRIAETNGEGGRLTVELANDSGHDLEVGPHHWILWRRTDGAWHTARRGVGYDLAVVVSPGESYTWYLHVVEVGTSPPPSATPRSSRSNGVLTVYDLPLSSGEYLFGVPGVSTPGTETTLATGFSVR